MDRRAIMETGFRAAMRRLAATVTVISTHDGKRDYGMTATSVASLSMDPPSLTVAINRSASIHDPLLARGTFCVNLLRAGQEEHCRVFATRPDGEWRFQTGSWERSAEDLPYLVDAQANLFCRVGASLTYGSHTIIVGEIADLRVAEDVAPLIYLNGAHLPPKGEAGGQPPPES